MQIKQTTDGELLELTVTGDLDKESSTHFQEAIDDHVRDGWHRILVRLSGVSYLSSAGINVLVTSKKRLEQLQGKFGICDLNDGVRSILNQTRLLDMLLGDPLEMQAGSSSGEYTHSLSSRIVRVDGLDLQIYGLDEEATSTCRVIGHPQPLFESSFAQEDVHRVAFPDDCLAIGLGGLPCTRRAMMDR